MKLATNIHRVSGHCQKDIQGQRPEVKVIARSTALFCFLTVCWRLIWWAQRVWCWTDLYDDDDDHYYPGWGITTTVRPAGCCPSVNTYFTWRDVSLH